jgi:hypothetical protein
MAPQAKLVPRVMRSGAARSNVGHAHSTWQLCRATTKDAADIYAAPCSMALQKKN